MSAFRRWPNERVAASPSGEPRVVSSPPSKHTCVPGLAIIYLRLFLFCIRAKRGPSSHSISLRSLVAMRRHSSAAAHCWP